MTEKEQRGILKLDGWAGTTLQPIIVVAETPKRYRIRAEQETRLAGRCRYLRPGETVLVPKDAVRLSGESGNA